jgi:glyceraldehyde-3-phosphate dehydrogenase (NADP+)
MPPVMKTGPDIFAFIGGHKVADSLLRDHPAPHRLKVLTFLQNGS